MKPLQHKKHTLAKRGLSLLCVLALCLGLLPVTALAAGVDAPNNLYVGNQNVKSGEDTTYWATTDSGELELVEGASDDSNDWTVKYDPNTATLTLKNATIKTTHDGSRGAMIYAQSVGSRAVSLTIQLVGENTIVCDSAYYGIYVDAEMSNDSYGTDASLTITGNGSLEVSGSSYGIWVKSGTGNASLNIKNVAVTSSTNGDYAAGVCVQSSTKATGSPQLSLAVDGGSLTTSASEGNDGIQFYVGLFEATGATTSLTVSDNAIVRANGGIKASRVDEPTPSGTGIVFDGTEGTVYGEVELQEDLEIGEGETLTIPGGSSLNANGKLTNDGTINVGKGGNLTGDPGGTVVSAPTIGTQPADTTVTEGQSASFTVAASGDSLTYQWQQSTNGSDWTNVGSSTSSNTYTIDNITTSMSGTQYRCMVSNSAGSVTSSAATLTVQAKPASVPVTGVSLDKDTLSLYTGERATLTATVAPSDAANQNVTWQSNNANVATIDNGTVTAVGAGNATITVTTQDGGKTDTCTVTVKEPPYSGKYSYEVFTSVGDNGTVTVDRYATEGDKVTIDVTPDQAYKLDELVVTANGKDVELTANSDGTYSFTMPSADVKITATFAEDPDWTEPEEPATDVSDIFLDVTPNAWYKDAVQYAYAGGLMTGVSANEFAPEATTTRAMIVSMLARLEGVESAESAGFADVAVNDWYATAVNWAASVGITSGTGDGNFSPNTAITREQLAAILMNYAQYKGQDVSARATLDTYNDATAISSWANDVMSWAVAEGLLTGVTADTLQPQGAATRAQVAAILQRFLSE